jgi:hypothetical protein
MSKPTTFDELRFGYFDVAFGNMLKAIRGGCNPLGVLTMAMCCINAFAEVEWSLDNQQHLESTGELKLKKRDYQAAGYIDNIMFKNWLTRWVVSSNLNANCDPAKVYGLRCSLVHTAGASETLSNTGVKHWQITTNKLANHYKVITRTGADPVFFLEMPDFLAELMVAADTFLIKRCTDINNASTPFRLRVGFIAILSGGTDANGAITTRLVRNIGSLQWFDKSLSTSPIKMSKDELADKIRELYKSVVHLVIQ